MRRPFPHHRLDSCEGKINVSATMVIDLHLCVVEPLKYRGYVTLLIYFIFSFKNACEVCPQMNEKGMLIFSLHFVGETCIEVVPVNIIVSSSTICNISRTVCCNSNLGRLN